MVGKKAGKTTRPAASCTECQRRKQKCSRQWPCNHCQARNIPHRCKYPQKQDVKSSSISKTTTRRLSLSSREEKQSVNTIKSEDGQLTTKDLSALASKDELRDLGYMPNDQNLLFGEAVPTVSHQALKQASDTLSPEMKNVLRLLPPKPYTDILVQRYLAVTNFSYYALYPPIFSQDYASWWSDRANGTPLTPEFTCLLIRVCACSAQYLDTETQTKFESDLGESVQSLSESYHYAAKQLSNTIPPGKGGLAQIQQLFLTSAWFKSESLFVESWHALSCCIHEAQELGMHKKQQKPGLSEFEVELRRRLWCLLYVWDWQMSLLLSRPFIINQASCPYELPNLQLEVSDPVSGPPSPVSHIAAQCELGQLIVGTPATMGGTADDSKADSIKANIEAWVLSLPPAYQEREPDTQWDEEYIHVPLQRRQLHAIGYMTMLLPFKSFLVKSFGPEPSEADQSRRATAIEIALHLMTVSHRLFDQVFPLNAKFHLATFLIFDTAAFLCSAMIHDKDHSLPRRDDVLEAIKLGCSLMSQLAQITRTGEICRIVLEKLTKSIHTAEAVNLGPPSMSDIPDIDNISPESLPPSLEGMSATDMFFPASLDLDFPATDMETLPIMSVGDFSGLDVGQFDQIWDWQNLDLTLLSSAHTK